ncbi:hypothetical protein SAY86_020244 [Trapa natans]|uniref:Uncharacterized protein n=1 Tax=Trapa natans TaxID=22666 RepID=A0AAN7LN39_TRANT|nr:hypothetical protein SAY86_020244 [Trapa natans]
MHFQDMLLDSLLHYLPVPSTLGPVMVVSWRRNEFADLWEGTPPSLNDKARPVDV